MNRDTRGAISGARTATVATTPTTSSLRATSGLPAAPNPSAESRTAWSILSTWTRKTSPQTCITMPGRSPVVLRPC